MSDGFYIMLHRVLKKADTVPNAIYHLPVVNKV